MAEVFDFLFYAYDGEEGLAHPLAVWLRSFGACIGHHWTLPRLLPPRASAAL